MDSALVLKTKIDSGTVLDESSIEKLLYSSDLIKSLTGDFSKNTLFPIWRLIALSEIPYAGRLQYTQNLVEYIEKAFSTSEGFSFTKKSTGLLPCYNAMIVEALVKLGYGGNSSVERGVDWIKKYQVFNRDEKTTWNGVGIKKFGGCMKSTPCYIGIAKSVKALIYYYDFTGRKDEQIQRMIENGTNYLLQHNLFQRLSDGHPINKHILDLAYPPSYQLNIIELLEVAFMTKNMKNPSVKDAIDYIVSKRSKDNDWRINYVYKADGYVSFDTRRKGEWITYLLEKFLSQA